VNADVYGQGLGLAPLAQMYPQRQPFPSEMQFFQQRPEVAGYAADDRSVVLNPNFGGSQESVLANERFRHLFQDNPGMLPSEMTALPHQVPSQQYAENPQALAATIIARLLSGDPSAAPYTWQQSEAAMKVLRTLQMLSGEKASKP